MLDRIHWLARWVLALPARGRSFSSQALGSFASTQTPACLLVFRSVTVTNSKAGLCLTETPSIFTHMLDSRFFCPSITNRCFHVESDVKSTKRLQDISKVSRDESVPAVFTPSQSYIHWVFLNRISGSGHPRKTLAVGNRNKSPEQTAAFSIQ